LASGVLPEQVDPQTGAFLSVSPLSWSHATFVAAVLDFVEKHRLLRQGRVIGHDTIAPATRVQGGERWT
jgi:hypothetical protein